MSKTILVTGATGKQGGSVIENLANNPEFTLLAVTRNTAGGSAQKLTSKGSNIKLVQGELAFALGAMAQAPVHRISTLEKRDKEFIAAQWIRAYGTHWGCA